MRFRIKVFFSRSFQRYNSTDVRVRFAPSPTGSLHLGGLRTAFYNYLFARKSNGKFILRIEDTDQKRVKSESIENLNSMLQWSSLIPDESPEKGGPFGPYLQSQRLQIYQDKAKQLLESGAAYRCFCSEVRLNILRKESVQKRLNQGYDNKCRHLTAAETKNLMKEGKAYTIRFKIPSNPVVHNDIVFGKYEYNLSENEGDFIILKSDGFPTYHFACVVDDHMMKISHVLRGAEWLISTPKHIAMYNAFDWHSPKYAHLPLLVNSDRTKLSKRQEAIGVEYFKNKGYSPEALLNFLAVAGGGFGKQEGCIVYDLNTLCSKFQLENVKTNSCIVDFKKLDLFNHDYLKQQLLDECASTTLIGKLRSALKEKYGQRYETEEANLSDSYMKKVLLLYKDRINNILEMTDDNLEYLWTTSDLNEIVIKISELKIPHLVMYDLSSVVSLLSSMPDAEFIQDNLSSKLKNIKSELRVPYMQLMRALRIILTGQKNGPGVAEILALLGKNRSLEKITAVVYELNSKNFKMDVS